MRSRRVSSRSVVLTAAFLALAAGGAAACDTADPAQEWESPDYNYEPAVAEPMIVPSTTAPASTAPAPSAPASSAPASSAPANRAKPATVPPVAEEVFYCADEEGEIVEEYNCAEDDGWGYYYLWHSPTYPRTLTPGDYLDGGDYFPASDADGRRAFKLPAAGPIPNGTIKTGVVGTTVSGTSGGS
ncbi:hypothetical protein OHA21_04825 [Actinoplanes sp. NBC_00393]|uniref:hypothetical protein n=1 Tax=Actinoplanes sp. NBC_00393 TaxID=2975953 RepID=UPI002E23EA48